MNYKITDKAKADPIAVPLPISKEYVGVGGKYEINETANCPSCSPEQQVDFEKQQSIKPKRFYREAEPHEYQALVEQYAASGGIPQYLILIPDQPAQKAETKEK